MVSLHVANIFGFLQSSEYVALSTKTYDKAVTYVIEALNLEIYNFLKNLHQNTAACLICTFYLEKYQSYKAFHVSHYDVIMTSYKP